MKSFTEGDRVHIPSIGTGVVREVRNGGRYLVEIKGRTIVVTGRDLERVTTEPASPGNSTRARAVTDQRPQTQPAPSLDLHGRTVIESLELLDAFLNHAILDGHAAVSIVHGRSGGRIKAAVHKRLRETAAVRSYRLDPGNPGATIVTF
jgi:DNA mismatch repair protein MutS2